MSKSALKFDQKLLNVTYFSKMLNTESKKDEKNNEFSISNSKADLKSTSTITMSK